MSRNGEERKPLNWVEDVKTMKIEADEQTNGDPRKLRRQATDPRRNRHSLSHPVLNGRPSPTSHCTDSASQSPRKQESRAGSPTVRTDDEETVGGDITVKLEPGKALKLSRSSSKKILSRPPPLFLDAEDSTTEATRSFELLTACTYSNKYLGTTDHALECDCTEEWDAATQSNNACGDDSDCINRATKMECIGDCNCGTVCQNQRFQHQQYANVSVIKTEKKGYGLRANNDLLANTFIFEYIGEVIGEAAFRRRIVQYDQEGVKHFYFMSLTKGEFVDATKQGNLGRFCNHSCNPNCYVDKWVVGDRLRMGIFAERKIAAGEELVFNYNVDRYGADPQPCYCGEPNCSGYIGGKTQTERATKLSAATIEALGIEDGDDWDIAVAKKGRKKKVAGEDDEEYVDSVQPKSLDEAGVTKVMSTLMQCKEKWIAVKLLTRIQNCDEDRVRNRVIKFHGYRILNTALGNFIDDSNVVLQILDILNKLPRITRNKIQDSKIEDTVEKLLTNENERVKEEAAAIMKVWNALEVAYRIPRMKRDPTALAAAEKTEREERRRMTRDRSRSRSRSESPDVPRGPSAVSGPRAGLPARPFSSRPPFRRPPPPTLPAGWFSAQANGKTYFYSASGQTTWQRPTIAAAQPPPPPREKTHEQKLQEIINSITTTTTTPRDRSSAGNTPLAAGDAPTPARKEQKEKWRSYSEEKRKKLYENTLFPHIKYVMDKFKGKLPKDDLKRFAKEVAKKLVNSDFKNKRVDDPTQISFKQERNVKEYIKEYFEKAAAKKSEYDQRKKAASSKPTENSSSISNGGINDAASPPKPADEEDIQLSESKIDNEDDDEPSTAASTIYPSIDSLKRKREADEMLLTGGTPDQEDASTKKPREDDDAFEPPPPPPPPSPPPSNDGGPEPTEEEDPEDVKMDLDEGDGDGDDEEFEGEVTQATDAKNGVIV